MILIMAARTRAPPHGRRECSDGRDEPRSHAATTTRDALRRTAARSVRPARGSRSCSPWSSWWSRRSPPSWPARSRCCPTPRHMLTDAVAIGLALGAIVVANRASHEGARTFGLFRLEILASLVERAARCSRSRATCSSKRSLRLVRRRHRRRGRARCSWSRSSGSLVNLVVFVMLRAGAPDSLAVESAYVDAMADAAGSVGVIVAAIVIATTGWEPIDPIVAVGHRRVDPAARVAASQRARCACCCRSRPRTSTSTRSAPSCRAPRCRRRARPPRVDAHVGDGRRQRARDGRRRAPTRTRARPGARAPPRHEIAHATIQVEPDDHEGCAELNW